jgi:hypothetical protein
MVLTEQPVGGDDKYHEEEAPSTNRYLTEKQIK